jgi:glycosidase
MGNTPNLRLTFARRAILALVCAIVACAARPASAADVWRMAGTFNGWNTADEAFTLTEVPGRPGVFSIERAFDVGTYAFKFVKNGSWQEGHFGAAETPGDLLQPGGDIALEIPVHGVFRITLFPGSSSWTFEVGTVDRPFLVPVIRGVPITGRPFVLDLTRSLLPLPHEEYDFKVSDAGRVVRVNRAIDRSLAAAVTPFRTGLQRFEILLTDPDGVEIRQPFDVWVDQRYGYRLVMVDDQNKLLPMTRNDEQFEPVGPTLHRVLIELDTPAIMRELSVRFGLQEVAAEREVRVQPGVYAIEVNNGTLRRRPIDEAGTGSTLLIPGNWTRFTYTPANERVLHKTVHLIGDFNGWAMPGAPGAIEMASRADGRFVTIIDVPEDTHRYAFVLDGKTIVRDTTNEGTARFRGQEVSVITVGRTAESFGPAPARMIIPEAIRHDPRSPRDFDGLSFGLGLVDLSVRTLADDAESAAVQFERIGADGGVERGRAAMRKVGTEAGFDRWAARITTGTAEFKYAFEFTDGVYGHITPDYQGVVRPDPLQNPDWAKGAVWYQIFAERFRNGNPLNDPKGPDVYPTPWNAHWYEPTPEELAAHRARYKMAPDEPLTPPTPYNNLFHVVWDRRYGGDLQGVVEKLDELADLGVTAIYFNPVFEAQSMHKYDATDFRHIDDNFGTPADAGPVPDVFTPPPSDLTDPATWGWTAADRYFVDVLIPEARARGIRIVIDGVFNHTGRLFPAFQDIVEKGAASPYADWFFAVYGEDGSLESWTAWDGPSGWLPKFKQNADRSLVAPVEKHIIDITRRWMDPNNDGDPSDGIDGWRLDVPLDVGLPFWERWRRVVKSINPDAVIIAEIWDEADPYLRGQHFDTHMNYPFARAVLDWMTGDRDTTSELLASRLEATFADAPQTNLIHQNLFSSHDSDRYVSKLLNPGRPEYDAGNRIQDGGSNLAYKEVKPPDDIYALSLVGVAIQATYIGAPCIYYADEVGAWGADDPSDRKPYPWPDKGGNLNPDDTIVPGIRDAYRAWFRLRQDPTIGPILRYGDVRHVDTGTPDVFAFVRSLNGVEVHVVANRAKTPFNASAILPGIDDALVDGLSARYWIVSPE